MKGRMLLPLPSYPQICAILEDELFVQQHDLIVSIIQEIIGRAEDGGGMDHLSEQALPWLHNVGSLMILLLASCGERRRRGITSSDNSADDYETAQGWLRLTRELQSFYDAREIQSPPTWLRLQTLQLSHQSFLIRHDPGRYAQYFPNAPLDMPYLWPALDGMLEVVCDREFVSLQKGTLVIPKKLRSTVAL